MLELLRHDYYWPKMRDNVIAFIKSCITCGRAKAHRHQPYGTLQQLPIPERPWHSVSMDFIEQLPSSSDYSTILIISDRLTKQALLLPTTDNVTSEEVVQLYFKNVFSRHGVPAHITSDCGAEFISHFFHSLGTLLGIHLHFTLGYHPQADGQTEIKCWSSTSTSIVTISRTTGPTGSPLLSSHTTMRRVRPPEPLCSSQTRVTTQNSPPIPITFPPPMPLTCYDPNIPRDRAGSETPPMAPCAQSLSKAAAFPFSCYTADDSDICIHILHCFITSLISLNIVVAIFPLITCS
jgi:hypothetical protein